MRYIDKQLFHFEVCGTISNGYRAVKHSVIVTATDENDAIERAENEATWVKSRKITAKKIDDASAMRALGAPSLFDWRKDDSDNDRST